MGWYIYPRAIGSEYGPCAEPCEHIDCKQSRKDAESICRICGKPIGYESRIYFEGDSPETHALVHADCLEDEVTDKRHTYLIPR